MLTLRSLPLAIVLPLSSLMPLPVSACGFGHVSASTLNLCLETAPATKAKSATSDTAMKAVPVATQAKPKGAVRR